MPVGTEFYCFNTDLASKVHNLTADDIRVYLSNAAPSLTFVKKADLAEITIQHGYTGPVSVTPSNASADAKFTLSGVYITISASGGGIGPFRYIVLFNNTPGTKPLIGWWDVGDSITINDGNDMRLRFDSVLGTGTILTIDEA